MNQRLITAVCCTTLTLWAGAPAFADCTSQRQSATNALNQARAQGDENRAATQRNRVNAIDTQCTQDKLRQQRTETIRNRAQEVQQRQERQAQQMRERTQELNDRQQRNASP